jgi:hypothetical protein
MTRTVSETPTATLVASALVAALAVGSVGAAAQGGGGGARQGGAANMDNVEVRSLHVQGNVWLINGGFVNAAVQIGDEGVLVVDTLVEPLAAKMIAEIKRLAGTKPIRYIRITPAATPRWPTRASRSSAGTSHRRSVRRRPTSRRLSRTRTSKPA